MSQTHTETHAKPQHGDDKKHGDVLESAMKDADTHNVEGAAADPVPVPDHGSHSHSHAAHLRDGEHAETKPQGNLRQGSNPGALRQPPMTVDRIGKRTKND